MPRKPGRPKNGTSNDLDEIDLALLQLLREDANRRLADLAQELERKSLGIHVSNISRRVKRLTEEGFLRFEAITNTSPLSLLTGKDSIREPDATVDELMAERKRMLSSNMDLAARDLIRQFPGVVRAVFRIVAEEGFPAVDPKEDMAIRRECEATLEAIVAERSRENVGAAERTALTDSAPSGIPKQPEPGS